MRSPNGHYLAQVSVREKPEGAPRWTWKYQLTVFDTRQEGARQSLWSCEYTHEGYSGGYLSDDGSTFAYVNSWYEPDGPTVSMYHLGKNAGVIVGREFNIPAAALRSTVSHQLWLDDSGAPNVRFVQTTKEPAPPSYYDTLAKECQTRQSQGCCLASVETMRASHSTLLPLEGCPAGYQPNGMRCIDSYHWCQPANPLPLGLEITTIDHQTHQISVESATLVKP
ncbi:MAG: hypothetical protein HY599_00490 [Candidatus Omnitrophica bacterium]|nr:hypothetical protein [Candidatus Omnitrophota bacterium]